MCRSAARPFLVLSLIAAGVARAAAPVPGEAHASRHFRLQKLADGVWAAVATPGGWAICNMGIIDLGKDVVLFDAGMSKQAASDLAAAAQQLTGRAPTHVVYSHGHNDHTRGAVGLSANLTVVATRGILEDLEDDEKWAKEQAPDVPRWGKVYAVMEEWEVRSGPPGQWHFWKGYTDAIADGLPNYVARKPTKYIEGDSLTLSGPKRKVVLKALRGHTSSDVIAVLPDDRIVFAGDLLFVGHHPWFGDSPGIETYLEALAVLEAEGARVYVPGHGELTGIDGLKPMRDYVATLRAVVSEARRQGLKEEWLAGREVPTQFSTWWFGHFYAPNIKVFFKETEPKKAP
jgi:cyclase